MTLQDSMFLAGLLLILGAVAIGAVLLGFFATVGLAKALMRPFEARNRRRNRDLADAIRPYERDVDDELAAAFRRQRAAAEARREARGGRP